MDKVWMLVHPEKGLWYSPPSTNPSDAWNSALRWEQWLLGGRSMIGWKKQMMKDGWRAKKVEIQYGSR